VNIAAVTWDAAGTLIAPHPSVGAVYAEVAGQHGFERDARELDAAFWPAFKVVQAAWRVPYGADDEDARRFWTRVIETTFAEPLPYELCCDLYDAFAVARRWRVLAGVRAALALIAARGLPQAVVSNFDVRLGPLLEECALGPFVAVVTSTAVGVPKPGPAVLLAACARLDVRPDQVLHVGDSEREDGGLCAATGARWLRVDAAVGIPLAELSRLLATP